MLEVHFCSPIRQATDGVLVVAGAVIPVEWCESWDIEKGLIVFDDPWEFNGREFPVKKFRIEDTKMEIAVVLPVDCVEKVVNKGLGKTIYQANHRYVRENHMLIRKPRESWHPDCMQTHLRATVIIDPEYVSVRLHNDDGLQMGLLIGYVKDQIDLQVMKEGMVSGEQVAFISLPVKKK